MAEQGEDLRSMAGNPAMGKGPDGKAYFLLVNGFNAAATYTPSAASYSAGNTVDIAKQFANIGPSLGGDIFITSVVFEIDESALISGETSYALEIYNVTPPSAQADNQAFAIPSGDRTAHIDTIQLGTALAKGGTLKVGNDGLNKQVTVLSGGSLWGVLVTNGGFTATAIVHKVTLHATGL